MDLVVLLSKVRMDVLYECSYLVYVLYAYMFRLNSIISLLDLHVLSIYLSITETAEINQFVLAAEDFRIKV